MPEYEAGVVFFGVVPEAPLASAIVKIVDNMMILKTIAVTVRLH